MKFDEKYRYSEDTLFNLKYLNFVSRIGASKEYYIVNEVEGSLSKVFSENRFDVYHELKDEMIFLAKKEDGLYRSINKNISCYFVDNMFARARETLSLQINRKQKTKLLTALIKSNIIDKKDIFSARGYGPMYIALFFVFLFKSGFLLWIWFILANKFKI